MIMSRPFVSKKKMLKLARLQDQTKKKKRSLEIKETEKEEEMKNQTYKRHFIHSQATGLVLRSSARYDRVGVGAGDLKQG